MHRVIAGCNLWALLFLMLALVLGATGSRHHVLFALFAVCFAMLAQCAIFALFMGASKLLKEHVEMFDLPHSLIDRTNELMIPLFRWASAGSMSALLLGILGGLTVSGDVAGIWHLIAGIGTMAVLVFAVRAEVPRLEQMHEVLVDMEAAVPEGAEPPAAAGDSPDLRGRALVYVGSTVLMMVLGYRYISGLTVPSSLLIIAVGFSLLCLVMAAWLRLRRPAPSSSS